MEVGVAVVRAFYPDRLFETQIGFEATGAVGENRDDGDLGGAGQGQGAYRDFEGFAENRDVAGFAAVGRTVALQGYHLAAP